MFDVQSVGCASQAEFHISGVAGLKSGQSNHQETMPFWRSFIQELKAQGSRLNVAVSLKSGQFNQKRNLEYPTCPVG
jgi:hypothetical protein